MVYITGDTHGEISRFCEAGMKGESSWGREDKLIICGDFGFIWYNEENERGRKYNNSQLDILSAKPYDILFIDGNHENFTELYKYPIVERYGAPVHKIRDNIYHLMRGNIYTVEDKTFFTFGGAYSIDKYMRAENISWWADEQPTDEEYEHARDTLGRCGSKVDYIITHTAPIDAIEKMKFRMPYTERNRIFIDAHELRISGFLNEIKENTDFKRWFFGHWHYDIVISDEFRALLSDVERIE